MLAAAFGRAEATEMLIAGGARIHRGENGVTPLMLASLAGNGGGKVSLTSLAVRAGVALHKKGGADWPETVRVLLQNGAEPKAGNLFGISALMFAAHSGQTEIAGILLDNGADVNQHDNEGWTPLMFAAERGHLETVQLLLRHGGDPDGQTTNGYTAMMIAAEANRPDVVRELMDAGADPSIYSAHDQTVQMAAARRGVQKVVRMPDSTPPRSESAAQ